MKKAISMKKKIIVVEDEGIIALDIKKRLEILGYNVSNVVDSGEKAIEEALKSKPDLIIMDIVLKGQISGMDAALYLKEYMEIPVIYLTSYFDEEYKNRCNCSKLNYDFLIKPFNQEDLKYKARECAAVISALIAENNLFAALFFNILKKTIPPVVINYIKFCFLPLIKQARNFVYNRIIFIIRWASLLKIRFKISLTFTVWLSERIIFCAAFGIYFHYICFMPA